MITRLQLSGMSCQRCVQAVFTSLTPVSGIVAADVSIGRATIEHDGQVTLEALREAIAVTGYEIVDAQDERRALRVI